MITGNRLKRSSLVLWPVMIIACFVSAMFISSAAESGNLIGNPLLEEKDSDGFPVSWRQRSHPSEGTISLTTQSFKGKHALMGQISGEQSSVYVGQTVRIENPGKYLLRFYARAAGPASITAIWTFRTDSGTRIEVQRPWLQRPLSPGQASGWTMVEEIIEVPEDTARMNIWLRGLLQGGSEETAVVFFDDISLVNLADRDSSGASPPEGARLVLSEDFSSGEVPPGWVTAEGDWKVENNALAGENGLIFYTGDIGSPNMRIEYTAWADSRPGDLSAVVSAREPAPFARAQGYFFGFGCMNNTENKILSIDEQEREVLAYQGGTWEVYRDPINPGVKHEVVVQRDHNELKLFIDGKLVLEGNDPFFGRKAGEGFGFYIWNRGYIGDVKVYALPWQAGGAAGERDVEFQMHEGFEDFPEGEEYGGFLTERGSPSIRIVDRPTWIYKEPMGNEYVTDHCLEIIASSPDADMRISKSFKPLDSGIIEFDVLAEEHGEFRFSLADAGGENVMNLIIGRDGRFMTEDAQGRRILRDTIRYQRRRFDADFRFMKNRWYTFRLHFSGGLRQIALIDHYSELDHYPLGNLGEYLPLDYALSPVEGKKGASFSVSAEGETRFYFDNLIIAGPVGTDTVSGRPLTQSAAKLLDIEFPGRKDPFRLKLQTYRHVWAENNRQTPRFLAGDEAPGYAYFRAAGDIYNEQLVDLAFIEEKINMLRRSAFYMRQGELRPGLEAKLAELDIMHKSAEALMEKSLQLFAGAYLDNQDEEKLAVFSDVAGGVSEKLSSMHALIDTALRGLMPAAVSEEVVQHPAPVDEGRITWNSGKKRWERNGAPVLLDYFARGNTPSVLRNDMKLLGFPRIPPEGTQASFWYPKPWNWERWSRTWELEEGAYVMREEDDEVFSPAGYLKRAFENDSSSFIMHLRAGTHYACMSAPGWWWEKHKEDDDIVFCRPDGTPVANPVRTNNQIFLNFWHPEVKRLIDEQFRAVGKLAEDYKSAVSHFTLGMEIKNTFPGGMPGYNKNAVKQFREELREKYRTIVHLNSKWNTDYGSFDEIVPPPERSEPSGLRYEFMKFSADGFNNWLASIRDAVQYYSRDIPVANDEQDTFGFRTTDLIGFIRASDIKLYHTYQEWDRKIVDRWHHQIAEKALGTPWGTLEWTSSQGTPYMFQLDRIRNSALREKSMQMIWGATMRDVYTPRFTHGGWQYGSNIYDPRLDKMVLNYAAPFYSVSMERARRLGEAALTAPTTKPEIGLLEATSSWYNGLGVRGGMRHIAGELAETGWNYEFLYEQLLEEGLQTLDGIEVLFAPAGLCMTDELREAVYGWVESGGVLIASGGPAGVMNQYGQPVCLQDVFESEWIRSEDGWELEGVNPVNVGEDVKMWEAGYGLGRAIVFSRIAGEMFDLLPLHAKQRLGSDNREVQFCLREKDGVKYLYALNWSVYETREAEIFLEGGYSSVVDLGLQLPLEVPSREKDGRTYFSIRLAPAEVTLLRITE